MKLTVIFIIFISLLSCSRKSDVELDLDELDMDAEKVSSSNEEISNKSNSFSSLPLINLYGPTSRFQILDISEKVIKDSSININRHSYIRKKASALIDNPYADKIEVEDIHTFEYSIGSDEILKTIGSYYFHDFSKLKFRTNTSQLIESTTEGIIDSLEYESQFTDVESSRLQFVLRNTPAQTKGFEFGVKPRESYVLKLPAIELDLAVKRLLSGSRIKFEVTNYEIEENNLIKWRDNVLSEGSILLITKEDRDSYFFIPSGKSVQEVLSESNKNIFDLNSDFRMINFSKINEPLSSGKLVVIYILGDDGHEFRNNISEEKRLKEYSFIKKRNHKVEFLIQKKGVQHSVKHWKESEGITTYENGKVWKRRTCKVSRRKIVKNNISLDSSKYKGEYSFMFEGKTYSLEALMKEKRASIISNGLTQKISLLNLPGNSDRIQVKFLINSTLSKKVVSQDKANCTLSYERRVMDGGENSDWIRLREEKFDNFKESRYQGLVGLERFMDLIIVN